MQEQQHEPQQQQRVRKSASTTDLSHVHDHNGAPGPLGTSPPAFEAPSTPNNQSTSPNATAGLLPVNTPADPPSGQPAPRGLSASYHAGSSTGADVPRSSSRATAGVAAAAAAAQPSGSVTAPASPAPYTMSHTHTPSPQGLGSSHGCASTGSLLLEGAGSSSAGRGASAAAAAVPSVQEKAERLRSDGRGTGPATGPASRLLPSGLAAARRAGHGHRRTSSYDAAAAAAAMARAGDGATEEAAAAGAGPVSGGTAAGHGGMGRGGWVPELPEELEIEDVDQRGSSPVGIPSGDWPWFDFDYAAAGVAPDDGHHQQQQQRRQQQRDLNTHQQQQQQPAAYRARTRIVGWPRAVLASYDSVSEHLGFGRTAEYVVYVLHVSDEEGEWAVARRYRHFEALHHRLLANYPG